MTEVPERLVPTDGLTRSKLTFVGIDYEPGTKPAVRFRISAADGRFIGDFPVSPDVAAGAPIDVILTEAHAEMRDILRQWLHCIDVYEVALRGGGRPTT